MKNRNRSVMKQAALETYKDFPDVVSVIEKMDFTKVDDLYNEELKTFVSEKEMEEVESFIESEVFARYMQGSSSAACLCAELVLNEVHSELSGDSSVSKVLH